MHAQTSRDLSATGIELHTGTTHMGQNTLEDLTELLESIRKLYQAGFRLVSNVNNDCVGKSDDKTEFRYMSLMEAVFYKPAK